MKKNIKKFLPAIAIISCLSTTTTMAEYNPDKEIIEGEVSTKNLVQEISETEETLSTETIEENNKETEEVTEEELETLIENVKLIKVNDNLLFPLREVMETLEYEVEWNGETKSITLTKLPHFITLSINKDAYTFAKMGPIALGQSPIIIEEKTYVPVSLLTDLIGIDNVIINNDKTLTIKNVKEDENVELPKISEVEILSIEDERILVKDSIRGEVFLNLGSEETIIETTEDFKVGQIITVEYGTAMTMSLPPINTPIKISPADSKENNKEELTISE